MRLHGRRDQIAKKIVTAIVEGQIHTPGQVTDVIARLEILPERLRNWALTEMRRLGSVEFADFLAAQLILPSSADNNFRRT